MSDLENDNQRGSGGPEQPGRTWREVAKEIANEPSSEKLSELVKELCDLLDRSPKGPLRVELGDVPIADIRADNRPKKSAL